MNGRGAAACLAILGVLGLGFLPAEHAHARTEDGHHTGVVHRHFEPHHSLDGGIHHFDDDDDHDGGATFLATGFTAPKAAGSVYPLDVVLPNGLRPMPVQPAGRWVPPSPDASGHDPPWAASLDLRGPPDLLV